MTCKDCIHERVCLALIEKGLPWADGEYPAEAFCMTFRNKSNFVDKTEVAREIFAEIEELKNIIKLNLNSKELQGLEKPINSMIRDSIDLILLELKNKYTKEGVK